MVVREVDGRACLAARKVMARHGRGVQQWRGKGARRRRAWQHQWLRRGRGAVRKQCHGKGAGRRRARLAVSMVVAREGRGVKALVRRGCGAGARWGGAEIRGCAVVYVVLVWIG